VKACHTFWPASGWLRTSLATVTSCSPAFSPLSRSEPRTTQCSASGSNLSQALSSIASGTGSRPVSTAKVGGAPSGPVTTPAQRSTTVAAGMAIVSVVFWSVMRRRPTTAPASTSRTGPPDMPLGRFFPGRTSTVDSRFRNFKVVEGPSATGSIP
jgi:hypothetical protein